MTKRRGHGEGSIYQLNDGSWAASLDLGWVEGKRKRKKVTGKTRREVTFKLDEVKHNLKLGKPLVDSQQQLGAFLQEWLADAVTPTVRPKTLMSYKWVVESHLEPSIGTVRLANLRASHVQKLIAEKVQSGLSNRSVEYIWQVLRRSLKVAVRWGLIAENVAENATPPRPVEKEVKIFTPNEVDKIVKGAKGRRHEAAFLLALTCGLRRGEILGLHWTDLDLDATPGKLTVRTQLQRLDGELRLTEPKSANSRRTISLPKKTREALRRHRSRQARERRAAGSDWRDCDLVFSTPLGGPVEPTNLLRSWRAMLDALGVSYRPLHPARHTAVSLLISEGLSTQLVSEAIGHSNPSLTARLYRHILPGDADRAAEAMDRALGR